MRLSRLCGVRMAGNFARHAARLPNRRLLVLYQTNTGKVKEKIKSSPEILRARCHGGRRVPPCGCRDRVGWRGTRRLSSRPRAGPAIARLVQPPARSRHWLFTHGPGGNRHPRPGNRQPRSGPHRPATATPAAATGGPPQHASGRPGKTRPGAVATTQGRSRKPSDKHARPTCLMRLANRSWRDRRRAPWATGSSHGRSFAQPVDGKIAFIGAPWAIENHARRKENPWDTPTPTC